MPFYGNNTTDVTDLLHSILKDNVNGKNTKKINQLRMGGRVMNCQDVMPM